MTLGGPPNCYLFYFSWIKEDLLEKRETKHCVLTSSDKGIWMLNAETKTDN